MVRSGPAGRKHPGRGDTTKAALLRAAVEAVVEHGWQAAGSRSVTARAGVPLGALNYHFGTKEELLRQATMTEVEAMFATPWQIIASSGSVEELVAGMVGWCRSPDVTSRQQILLLEVMAQTRRDPKLALALDTGLGGYRYELARALHRLRVVPICGAEEPSPDAIALASAFAAQCNGLWLQYVTEPSFPHDAATASATAAWTTALTTRTKSAN